MNKNIHIDLRVVRMVCSTLVNGRKCLNTIGKVKENNLFTMFLYETAYATANQIMVLIIYLFIE